MNRGRRSMGTLKVDSKPQRSSNSGVQASAKKSRLPTAAGAKLGGVSSASKNRGRSGSTGGRPGSIESVSRVSAALGSIGGSSFKTPRSKSSTNRTPSSNRQPLANIHSNGPKRSSVYGRSSISGKHNKENRPLNDRDWQRDVVRDLVNFCLNNDYINAGLTTKDFHPINTTTFRSIVEFLYGFLVPGFQLPNPKVTPVHEVLTDILKKMNYPGTVSKSHFQTLGGPSWGNIVGVLHFFLQLAKSVVALSKLENFNQMNFPNIDADGFEIDNIGTKSIAEIEYKYFLNCYDNYNKGNDEFHLQEQDLYWDLMDSKEVNEEFIQELAKKVRQFEQENKNLREDTGDVESLNEESAKVLSDIKGLQSYLEQLQTHLSQKQTDFKARNENIKQFAKRIAELQDSITVLESDCRNKGIDPKDNSNHAEEFVLALQARVEAKKADVHEADKLKWEHEQKISNKTAKLDECRRDCNHLIIGLDMVEDDSKALIKAEPDVIQNWAQSQNLVLKEEIRQLKKNCEDLKRNLSLSLVENEKKSKEDNQLKKDEMKIQTEKAQLIPQINQEEEDLKFKLKQAKTKMDAYFKNSSGLKHNLKDKEVQYEIVRTEYEELLQELEDVKRDAKETLEYIMDGMQKQKTFHNKNKAEALKRYANYSKKLSKSLKEESVKIQTKLDKISK